MAQFIAVSADFSQVTLPVVQAFMAAVAAAPQGDVLTAPPGVEIAVIDLPQPSDPDHVVIANNAVKFHVID